MSAYLQSRTHIGAIVRWAMRQHSDRSSLGLDDTYESAERVCEMLARENVRSIHYRYPDTVAHPEHAPGPADPLLSIAFNQTFERFTFTDCPLLSAGEVIQAICGLEYQSCEHPEWETSEARKWLDRCFRLAVSQLPEVEKAETWSIDDAPPANPVMSLTEIMEGR
jgi:hypothetical protein